MTTSLAKTELQLASLALGILGEFDTLSQQEQRFCRTRGISIDRPRGSDIREQIAKGGDPLGETLTILRTPEQRRPLGAVYTPHSIVKSMVGWAQRSDDPVQVVDPGAGSGRFLLAAALRFKKAHLIGIEIDPLSALILRANVRACNLDHRTTILVGDFRSVKLPERRGPTLFIGNPPYVRHHNISPTWKQWLSSAGQKYGITISQLAGLHIHFFIKTLLLAQPGDYGTYITSAEWLDVNYGRALRYLLCKDLGGIALHIVEPKTMPFANVASTGVITCFRVGTKPKHLRVRSVSKTNQLNGLNSGTLIPVQRVMSTDRWSLLIRQTPKPPRGYIELGSVCRVHRGQVTGNNEVWIASPEAPYLPSNVLFPTVTKAKDILHAGSILADASRLRRVISLPIDLTELEPEYRRRVQNFLRWAKERGADQSYIARHRRAWWSVELYDPAPILCTYMARRPPVFIRNLCLARHINIAHGLYPIQPLSEEILTALTKWLNSNVTTAQGRTYAGGLTKFEPKEVERIPIPALENLLT